MKDPDFVVTFQMMMDSARHLYYFNKWASKEDEEWSVTMSLLNANPAIVGFINFPLRQAFLKRTNLEILRQVDE